MISLLHLKIEEHLTVDSNGLPDVFMRPCNQVMQMIFTSNLPMQQFWHTGHVHVAPQKPSNCQLTQATERDGLTFLRLAKPQEQVLMKTQATSNKIWAKLSHKERAKNSTKAIIDKCKTVELTYG